jgi:hypothetical protein
LTHLTQLNAPPGTGEELDNDLSYIDELEKLDLGEVKEVNPVAV